MPLRKKGTGISLPTLSEKRKAIKRLHRHLECAPKIEFLLAIKSIRDIQSGHPEKRNNFDDFPPEAITSETTSSYFFFPWILETLANELMTARWNPRVRNDLTRTLNPRSYHSIRQLYNLLYYAEGASDGPVLRRVSVTKQIQRLIRRQAEWQRKISTLSRLRAYHSIYCTPESRDFFRIKYGLELDSFTKCTFSIFSLLIGNNCVRLPLNGASVGLSQDEINRTINILSLDAKDASTHAISLRRDFDHIGYAPSIFRKYPLIRFRSHGSDFLTTPISDLVFFRMTEGLFYDFVENAALRNVFSANLESLVKSAFSRSKASFEICGEVPYGKPKAMTPDVLVIRNSYATAAIEVKGRRQNAKVRFGEDPLTTQEEDYRELAKGVCQLWKYCQDSESGKIPEGYRANNDTVLALCTLDTWLEMSWDGDEVLMGLAHRMADNSTQPIPLRFRRMVARFSYGDLSNAISLSNAENTIDAIRLATTEKYRGWLLSSILADAFQVKDTSVDVTDETAIEVVVPWWKSFED